jgi:hypothetical protein
MQELELTDFRKEDITVGSELSSIQFVTGTILFLTKDLMSYESTPKLCIFVKGIIKFSTLRKFVIFLGVDRNLYRLEFEGRVEHFSFSKVKIGFKPFCFIPSYQYVFLIGDTLRGEFVVLDVLQLKKLNLSCRM